MGLLPGLAVAQADDRDYLTALLEDNLSGAGRVVTITGFTGALSSRATLEQLTIADDDGVWLTLTDVSLDWRRAALLSGAFVVNSLTATEIVLDRIPATESTPSAEATAFALPELPVSVSIGEITAARISLGESVLGEPVEASISAALQLAGGEGAGSFVLERTDDKEARIELSASYANSSGQLEIELEAVEGADGLAVRALGVPGAPSAELVVRGEGPVTDFAADVALRTDDVDRLAGTVALTGDGEGTNGFNLALSGDIAPVFLPKYAGFFGPEVNIAAAGSRDPLGRLSLAVFRVQAQALDLYGSASLAPDYLPTRFDVTGKLGLADGSPLLLPLGGEETRVSGAVLDLKYDMNRGEGWSGEINLTGLDRADFKAEALLLDGSGRISREGPVVGGTLNFAALGLLPANPDLARALGAEVSGKAVGHWEAGTGVTRLSRLVVE
ncbi:MAG: translocation/assembly module TamB domain-containing protein, partial [Paracoccaceae bacterium]